LALAELVDDDEQPAISVSAAIVAIALSDPLTNDFFNVFLS
jgi:hypothetical protein